MRIARPRRVLPFPPLPPLPPFPHLGALRLVGVQHVGEHARVGLKGGGGGEERGRGRTRHDAGARRPFPIPGLGPPPPPPSTRRHPRHAPWWGREGERGQGKGRGRCARECAGRESACERGERGHRGVGERTEGDALSSEETRGRRSRWKKKKTSAEGVRAEFFIVSPSRPPPGKKKRTQSAQRPRELLHQAKQKQTDKANTHTHTFPPPPPFHSFLLGPRIAPSSATVSAWCGCTVIL